MELKCLRSSVKTEKKREEEKEETNQELKTLKDDQEIIKKRVYENKQNIAKIDQKDKASKTKVENQKK